MIIEAQRDNSFLQAVNHSMFTTADGVPVQKSLKLLFDIRQERIAGMDTMPKIISESAKLGMSIFFYGSTPNVLNQIKRKITEQYPSLKIAGMISPPFEPNNHNLIDEHIKMINNSGANIVMIALGCPKQEKWMYENSGKINAVLLGLGGAFEVFADMKGRAPKWLRRIGMEWTYRLIQDPKRLWKRYLFTNALFLVLFIRELIQIRIFKKVV